jgi:hypothetical protein
MVPGLALVQLFGLNETKGIVTAFLSSAVHLQLHEALLHGRAEFPLAK